MAFVPESGATLAVENTALVIEMGVEDTADTKSKPLTAADIDTYFAALSERLTRNPKYRIPGNNQPFQTIIVVHGGAVFVKLIESRQTTFDIDYLAAYTDLLLEDKGLEDPIVLINAEILAVGKDSEGEGAGRKVDEF